MNDLHWLYTNGETINRILRQRLWMTWVTINYYLIFIQLIDNLQDADLLL